eukprot:jgi/Bigna1/33961/e_gw1.4.134.1
MGYLAIVAKGDVLIYETKLPASGALARVPENQLQFIVHQALDSLDEKIWNTTNMYMKEIDRFNNMPVSAYVTAGHIKFMLLHQLGQDENSIKQFFNDLYKLYIKVAMNPFYLKNTPINSSSFNERVKILARNHFFR